MLTRLKSFPRTGYAVVAIAGLLFTITIAVPAIGGDPVTKALKTAKKAKKSAKKANNKADDAQGSADDAQGSADAAQGSADAALTAANTEAYAYVDRSGADLIDPARSKNIASVVATGTTGVYCVATTGGVDASNAAAVASILRLPGNIVAGRVYGLNILEPSAPCPSGQYRVETYQTFIDEGSSGVHDATFGPGFTLAVP